MFIPTNGVTNTIITWKIANTPYSAGERYWVKIGNWAYPALKLGPFSTHKEALATVKELKAGYRLAAIACASPAATASTPSIAQVTPGQRRLLKAVKEC